jgi:hypothetical protein
MFISGGKKGGDSGGDVGGEKEEVTAERMLKRKIAQQIAEVKEQICSFLRHGKGGFFSQRLAGVVNIGRRILLCNCLNSGISPKGL